MFRLNINIMIIYKYGRMLFIKFLHRLFKLLINCVCSRFTVFELKKYQTAIFIQLRIVDFGSVRADILFAKKVTAALLASHSHIFQPAEHVQNLRTTYRSIRDHVV